MAKKWPGMVVQRTFIKGHSFVYRLYVNPFWFLPCVNENCLLFSIVLVRNKLELKDIVGSNQAMKEKHLACFGCEGKKWIHIVQSI